MATDSLPPQKSPIANCPTNPNSDIRAYLGLQDRYNVRYKCSRGRAIDQLSTIILVHIGDCQMSIVTF
jgi:hypothetical protein